MHGNIRNLSYPQGLVPIEEVEQIVRNITNPVKEDLPLESDGGAYRAYCYNIVNKNK